MINEYNYEVLSREELERNFKLMKDNNIEVRETIILHNIKLVFYRYYKRFSNTNMNMEDIVAYGMIGLIKAVDTFRPDKKCTFTTYASKCIDNEILMFLRKNKKRNSEVSLEDSINFDSEGNELKLEDVFGTEDNVVEKSIASKDDKILLEKEVKNLASRDRNIIEQRYGLFGQKELTQKELADKLNISQSYISRIEKRVIKKLKLLMKI